MPSLIRPLASLCRPVVSVVIPAYNRAGCVRTAIDSALAQGVADIEVLVVDDGSTDATREIVASHPDGRVRLIARESNRGASAARNSGISASSGSFVAFLDSDDIWLPGKLVRQLAALDAPGAPGVSCTGVEIHLLDHGVTRIQPCEPTQDWARRLAMGCDLSPGTTQMTRRELFERVGPFDEALPRFEDWDWLLRYTRTYPVLAVREPLARVFNRRGRFGHVVAASAERFAAKHAATFASLKPADRAQALSDLWLQVVGTYAFEAKPFAALPYALKSARVKPLHTLQRLASGIAVVLRGRMVRQAMTWRL